MAGIKLVIKLGLALFLGVQCALTVDVEEYIPKFQVIDSLSLEEKANTICESNDDSKIFNSHKLLTELRDYIGKSSEPKLVECWSKFGQSVELADELVRASNDNVCDDKKISLIEDFHHKYISATARDTNERDVSQRAAPQILQNFFIIYARRIHIVCKNALFLNIQDLSAKDDMVSGFSTREEHLPIDDILDEFSDKFLFELTPKKEKFMFLAWNLIEEVAYESKDKFDFSKYFDLAKDLKPGQVYRVTVKMSDTTTAQTLQDHCRQHLQPCYVRTVLPVLRLIDLGYYLPNVDTIPERWYKATQVCETILPIRFVADSSLASDQKVLVPKEEVEQNDVDIEYPPLRPIPKPYLNSVVSKYLPPGTAKLEVDQVWNQIKSRKNDIRLYMSKISSDASALINDEQISIFLASYADVEDNEDDTDLWEEALKEYDEAKKKELKEQNKMTFSKGLKIAYKYGKLALKAPPKAADKTATFFMEDNPPPRNHRNHKNSQRREGMPASLMAVPMIG